jgi:hypothetical protein
MGKANVACACRIRPIYSIMALRKEATSFLFGLILYHFILSKSTYLSVSCYATGSYNRLVTLVGMAWVLPLTTCPVGCKQASGGHRCH